MAVRQIKKQSEHDAAVSAARQIYEDKGQEVTNMGDDGKIDVTVNDKPVVLEGRKQTGVTVKKAAIEQDVNIKEDFVLSIELCGGKTKLVGDEEEIEVRDGERFLAIENDDNS